MIDSDNGWNVHADDAATDNTTTSPGSGRLTILATGLATAVLASVWLSPPSMMLGVCASIATSCTLLLLEDILRAQKHEGTVNSVDGLLQRPSTSARDNAQRSVASRDMALAVAGFSVIASIALESFRSSELTHQLVPPAREDLRPLWKATQLPYSFGQDISGIALETGKAIALLYTVSCQVSSPFQDHYSDASHVLYCAFEVTFALQISSCLHWVLSELLGMWQAGYGPTYYTLPWSLP